MGLNLNHRLFRYWQYEFSILSPLNVLNGIMPEQHWDLLEI